MYHMYQPCSKTLYTQTNLILLRLKQTEYKYLNDVTLVKMYYEKNMYEKSSKFYFKICQR